MGNSLNNRKGKGISRLRTAIKKNFGKNFSSKEDGPGFVKNIQKLASAAVKKAALENRKFGLPAIHVRGDKVYEVSPGGEEHLIATVKSGTKKYRVGEILYSRKN